jgi:ABC-type lipoprotein export system ATPase subunit
MSIKIYVKYVKNNRDFHTTKLNLPTGNLDSKTSDEVMALLKTSAMKYEQTLIVITHNEDIAQMGNRKLVIADGKVVEQ